MCIECFSEHPRITPLRQARACLEQHTQYICGTCGRCICIEHDPNRGLQRWNFPFTSVEIAVLYLRTAIYSTKSSCGIYKVVAANGRVSYKIFKDTHDAQIYADKHKDKTCDIHNPVIEKAYQQFEGTQVRRLTTLEIEQYVKEQKRI